MGIGKSSLRQMPDGGGDSDCGARRWVIDDGRMPVALLASWHWNQAYKSLVGSSRHWHWH